MRTRVSMNSPKSWAFGLAVAEPPRGPAESNFPAARRAPITIGKRNLLGLAVAGVVSMLVCSQASAAWVAFNDVNRANDGVPTNANATIWGFSTPGDQTMYGGTLQKISDGSSTGVSVAFVKDDIQYNMSAGPLPGGDAAEFATYLGNPSATSAVSYATGSDVGTAGAVSLRIDFTGLDSTKTYEATFYGNRGSASYIMTSNNGRLSKVTISDYSSYTWDSSATNTANTIAPQNMVSGDSTYWSTGYAEDMVVRLTDIAPGVDGDFSVLFENTGAGTFGGYTVNTGGWYGPGMFKLEEFAPVPEPASAVLAVLGLAALVRLRGRRNM